MSGRLDPRNGGAVLIFAVLAGIMAISAAVAVWGVITMQPSHIKLRDFAFETKSAFDKALAGDHPEVYHRKTHDEWCAAFLEANRDFVIGGRRLACPSAYSLPSYTGRK